MRPPQSFLYQDQSYHHGFLSRQPRNGRERRSASCVGPRLGRNPAGAESSTAPNCFASGPMLLARGAGDPITGLQRAPFAYFWALWSKSKSRRRSEIFCNSSSAAGGFRFPLPLLFFHQIGQTYPQGNPAYEPPPIPPNRHRGRGRSRSRLPRRSGGGRGVHPARRI